MSAATGRLTAATGDRDIYRFFTVVNLLHENFYENDTVAQDIADSLDDVEALMDKLIPLLRQT